MILSVVVGVVQGTVPCTTPCTTRLHAWQDGQINEVVLPVLIVTIVSPQAGHGLFSL
jgi:hypothetical protein